MRVIDRIAIGTGVAVGAVATGGAVAARRFAGRLADYARDVGSSAVSDIDPAELPPVVARWLDEALPPERPRPAVVCLEQRFEMRLRDGGSWAPGTAVHLAAGGKPGLAWFGRVRLAPLVDARVYDALVAGEGFLDARLWGVVPIVRARGANATRGELQRYLAELPWTPLATLTNPTLGWHQLGDRSVEVSATVGLVEGRVALEFGEHGLPTGAYASARPRTERGQVIDRPWRGAYSEYTNLSGVIVPARAEVAWQLEGEWSSYWRGTVNNISVP